MRQDVEQHRAEEEGGLGGPDPSFQRLLFYLALDVRYSFINMSSNDINCSSAED